MTDQPHVETTPELSPEQAAELAAMDAAAAELVPELPGQGPDQEPEQEAQKKIPTAELVQPLVGLLCVSLAPAWAITNEEQAELSGAYALVIDKYFPDGVPMGPELGAVMITAAIVMPRLGKPLKEPEPEGADNADE